MSESIYQQPSTGEMISMMKSSSTRGLRERGFEWKNVGWDDCSRAAGSCLGSNISDWSFKLADGRVLPFIRRDNFKDETMTIRARDIAIVVVTPEGHSKAVTFAHYLKNFGRYTPGMPDCVDMSADGDDNEWVTVRNIAVVVPENREGYQEVVPTAYNYGTMDEDDPQNVIGASFHLGVGVRTDGVGHQDVYLVKAKGQAEVQPKVQPKVPEESSWSVSGALTGMASTMFSAMAPSMDEVSPPGSPAPVKRLEGFPSCLPPSLEEKILNHDTWDFDHFTAFLRKLNRMRMSVMIRDLGLTPVETASMMEHLFETEISAYLDADGALSALAQKWCETKHRVTYDSSVQKGGDRSTHENTWFRITNQDRESEEQKAAVGSVLGTRSTGCGRNRVQCFQIPREQKPRRPVYRGLSAKCVPKGLGIGVGNVSHGRSAGTHETKKISYKRNPDEMITMTFAHYYTTKDGALSQEDVTAICDTLDADYGDKKAAWVGSLVTGEAAEGSGSGSPPIQLPALKAEDVAAYEAKVKVFPRVVRDVTEFPC